MLTVGTRVIMIDDPLNEYLYQGKDKEGNLMKGVIMKITNMHGLPYEVQWDDESINSYGDKHVTATSEIVNNYSIY